MKIVLENLQINCKKSVETIEFSPHVTFFHGPLSTGKSTIARLIDYCFGADLEKTYALRSEFLSAQLTARFANYTVALERDATQTASVRVTWERPGDIGSTVAPIRPSSDPILPPDVHNLSDLLFHLAGTVPIKVRKSKSDPESALVRLGFRDVSTYCYLPQDTLDSSFYRMEDPFRRLKSRDAMRFFVGLHSERMNELDARLVALLDERRVNRIASEQIREFLRRFNLGTDIEIQEQLSEVDTELEEARDERDRIQANRSDATHAVEPLRRKLRALSEEIGKNEEALADLTNRIESQRSLRSEVLTSKLKSARVESARDVLSGVRFSGCPLCGREVASNRFSNESQCNLCGQSEADNQNAIDAETLRSDLNTRLDELDELINRHEKEVVSQTTHIKELHERKKLLDGTLTNELSAYDSAYVSQIKAIERRIAELEERRRQVAKLSQLPTGLDEMRRRSGELDAELAAIRDSLEDERQRLSGADSLVSGIERTFLEIMIAIGFPGIDVDDRVEINRQTWMPRVYHGPSDEEGWSFYEAGSGGKKVLFNVCYALATHRVAAEHDLPMPRFLIVDSPTKNISPDVNPGLLHKYFELIYDFAISNLGKTQFILIDSDLVAPSGDGMDFRHRFMTTDDPENPPLISYYSGP